MLATRTLIHITFKSHLTKKNYVLDKLKDPQQGRI